MRLVSHGNLPSGLTRDTTEALTTGKRDQTTALLEEEAFLLGQEESFIQSTSEQECTGERSRAVPLLHSSFFRPSGVTPRGLLLSPTLFDQRGGTQGRDQMTQDQYRLLDISR